MLGEHLRGWDGPLGFSLSIAKPNKTNTLWTSRWIFFVSLLSVFQIIYFLYFSGRFLGSHTWLLYLHHFLTIPYGLQLLLWLSLSLNFMTLFSLIIFVTYVNIILRINFVFILYLFVPHRPCYQIVFKIAKFLKCLQFFIRKTS